MKHLKTIITTVAAGTLLAVAASAQSPQYTVTDLGFVGPAGQPFVVTNNGLVAGTSAVGNTVHSVLWYKGRMIDIGTPGVSYGFAVNQSGQTVGAAQTSIRDPNGEDFCGFSALGLSSSGGSCVPFLWQNGVLNPLPTLGGRNGVAKQINSRGEAVGMAENQTRDTTCPSSNPQKLQFKPVIWKNFNVYELPTGPDPDGFAMAINDRGQVAGSSGDCTAFNPISQNSLAPHHAMLWDGGNAIGLGSLGGTGHGFGNMALYLNNRAQVVGASDLKGDTNFHAFLWTAETGMQDLGTVPGDVNSLAIGINDAGQVVGASLDDTFTPRAFLRVGSTLADLNQLVPGGSPLLLFTACSINARGEITGIGIDKRTGDFHAYLASPKGSGDDQ